MLVVLQISFLQLNRDVIIQTTNIEKTEKLKKEDGWTKVLENKAKLT